MAKANGNFKTLLRILSELEHKSMTLVDILTMQREVTIFAPNDEAFAKLPEGTLESLTDEQKLTIVSRHIAPGVSLLAGMLLVRSTSSSQSETLCLHRLGVEDNEEDQSCSNPTLGSRRVPIIHLPGCGVGSRFRRTLQIQFRILNQACNTTTPPLNKQTSSCS